jgi:hypothetical protein
MTGKKIPLGAAARVPVAKTSDLEIGRRVEALEELMKTVFDVIGSESFANIVAASRKEEPKLLTNTNKDGIPIGMPLYGESQRGGLEVLTVLADCYELSGTPYQTLSAAAEATSGVRRSGWAFWRTPEGASAKEAFGK